MDLNHEAFVVYVVFINRESDIHLSCRAWIAFLKVDDFRIPILSKYTNFANIFFKNLVAKLLEYIKINNHAINLIDGHYSLYGPIYSLKLTELKILKIYIKTNLSNNFIRFFKSLIGTLMLFLKKLNASLRLCIDY